MLRNEYCASILAHMSHTSTDRHDPTVSPASPSDPTAHGVGPGHADVPGNPASPPGDGPDRPLWRSRDYLLWFSSDVVGDLGSSLRAFAMPLIAYAVTGSATQAGLVGTLTSVAFLAATVPGGVLVDRVDRKLLILVGQLLRATVYTLAALAWWTGLLSLPVLLAVALASGACSGLFSLASDAAIKHVVPPDQMAAAAGANQARTSVVDLLSKPLGGLLLGLSPAAPFLAETTGHLLGACCIRAVHADMSPTRNAHAPQDADAPSGQRPPSAWRAYAQGWSWLLGHRVVLVLAVYGAVGSLSLSGVLTAVTLDWRSRGMSGTTIGALMAVPSVAMLLGAMAVPSTTRRVRGGAALVVGNVLVSGFMVAAALVAGTTARTILLACACTALPVVNSVASGLVMSLIPSEVMGRLVSAVLLINMGLPALAPYSAGRGLDVLGAPTTIIAFALVGLASLALVLSRREIRQLGYPDQWQAS